MPATPGVTIALRATVLLMTSAGSLCAGTFVTEHVILTAKHCTEHNGEPNEIVYITRDEYLGARTEAEFDELLANPHATALLCASEDQDLALLASFDAAPAVVPTAAKDVTPGDTIFTIGHPKANLWATSGGLVLTNMLGVASMTARTLPGSSGGGMFNERWELVGVVVRYSYEWLGYAQNAETVAELVATCAK